MKKLLFALTVLFVLPLSVLAQRTIENPVVGARSMGTCTGLFIEKIELTKKATKLFLIYYHGMKDNPFRYASGTTLRSGDKQWKLISADGIKLDDWVYPKDDGEFITRFVLNFQPIDNSVETIDFVEADDINSFILYDIALTDKAAEEIKRRISVPDGVKTYAKNIKDNGQSLDQNEFSMEPATVKGTIYAFDKRCFGTRMSGDVTVYIWNPFYGDQLSYSAPINPDNTFEIEVPMTTKNQIVYLSIEPVISNNVLLTAGKTVVVDYDFYEVYKPWELPDRCLNPYFSGENVDLNYALTKNVIRSFSESIDRNNSIAGFSMAEYKDYVLKKYEISRKNVDTLNVTKRGKELLNIELKSQAAYYFSMGASFIELANTRPNGNKEPNPDFKRPEMDKDYLDYPKILGLDDIMMFYASWCSYNVTGWRSCAHRVFGKNFSWEEYKNLMNLTWKELDSYTNIPENEKPVYASLVEKMEKSDTTRTEDEKNFYAKYWPIVGKRLTDIQNGTEETNACMNEIFGVGDSYFKDFIKLQEYCNRLGRQIVVPDSIMAEIEKMRFPFYADYVKAQNAEITAKIEAEKARGGYFMHQAGESEGDALFVDLIKDFKGKVVLIDFWNTWCGPCRQAMKQMEPMEKEYEGKDVVFLYLADESSPLEEYNNLIVSMKGHHYRLTQKQSTSLKNKWKFSGIPSYVIVGRDGMVKDFHTGFHGADYYKAKLEEELGK
ncbi:MAG: TlpA family protein disulfide reductase [Salinivirgaceae bacterium]|nr:TlpA family protein disulfide reductase [Salinivirgaceae bacterium]